MRITRGYGRSAAGDAWTRGASAAIGNFDGVHLGHAALLKAAGEAVPGAPEAVVTFEPHPRRFFQPDAPPFRLTTAAERVRLVERLGAAQLCEIAFDAHLSAMSPETFARAVLVEGLGLAHVTVGEDFRFGKGRAGGAEALEALGRSLGFGVSVLGLVGDETGEFSSTAARAAIREGRMEDAAHILGRHHAVTGRVREGDRRGRELGYPTANLDFGEQIVPRYGVYAARVEVREGPHAGLHDAVASIGERPTFGVNAPNFEVHLFDFAGDLYGTGIVARLVRFLRPEVAYEGPEALIAQMDRDSEAARAVLAQVGEP